MGKGGLRQGYASRLGYICDFRAQLLGVRHPSHIRRVGGELHRIYAKA